MQILIKTISQIADWVFLRLTAAWEWFEGYVLWPSAGIAFVVTILTGVLFVITLIGGGLILLGYALFDPVQINVIANIYGWCLIIEVATFVIFSIIFGSICDHFDRLNGMY